MNPQKKSVAQQAKSLEQTLSEEHGQNLTARDFASIEEMLRHDAAHTPAPPAIADRLQTSLSQLPPPPRRSWWRRMLGGSAS